MTVSRRDVLQGGVAFGALVAAGLVPGCSSPHAPEPEGGGREGAPHPATSVVLLGADGAGAAMPRPTPRRRGSLMGGFVFPFTPQVSERSFHHALRDRALEHRDVAGRVASFDGPVGLERVSAYFGDRVEDARYLAELRQRCQDVNVSTGPLEITGEGDLAEPEESDRRLVLERHVRWMHAAKSLGCSEIRLPLERGADADERGRRTAGSLHALSEEALRLDLTLLAAYGGGDAHDLDWLAETVTASDATRVQVQVDLADALDGRVPAQAEWPPPVESSRTRSRARAVALRFRGCAGPPRDAEPGVHAALGALYGLGFSGALSVVCTGGSDDEERRLADVMAAVNAANDRLRREGQRA